MGPIWMIATHEKINNKTASATEKQKSTQPGEAAPHPHLHI